MTLLMIPGPTMVTPDVLAAGARPVLGHGDPAFRSAVGRSLGRLRELFAAPSAQPIVTGGSGTLAMEIALANLIEPGDRVLILETGVFAHRFKAICDRNGAEVRLETAPLGQPNDPERVRTVLAEFRPKVLTITHVDTSTGVRVDVPALAKLGQEHGAIVVVDGVCSVGGEEYRGDEWGADVALTASQKAIGAPPGLAIVTVGPRARAVREGRKGPYSGYFTDWLLWLPVMESYERQGPPGYFGTPSVSLLAQLDVALEELLAEGLSTRTARHAKIAGAFKAGVAALGLSNAASCEAQANTLTVVRYPDGVGDELVDAMAAEGVAVAKSIHPELRGKALRVGHMGLCGAGEILTTLGALERGLKRVGAKVRLGAGLAAAQEVLVG